MSLNNIPVHTCMSLFEWASLLRFYLCPFRLQNRTTYILSSTDERTGRKWNKIKIKRHKRSCWLVSSQPSSCVQVITDCRAAERWAPVWLWQRCMVRPNMWTEPLWEAGREEMTHLSASPLNYIMEQSFPRRLLFEITSRSFQLSFKLQLEKKKNKKQKARAKGYTQSSLSLLLGRSALASRQ